MPSMRQAEGAMNKPEGPRKQVVKLNEAAKERRGRRVRVDCKLFIFGDDDFEAEVHVLDLSAGGCSAESAVPVHVGMELRLSLFLADHRWPIRIDGAVVRWVAGRRIGIEFFKLTPSVQDRIRQFVRKHTGLEV